MKRSRFTEVQVAYALRQAEAGMPVIDVCRGLGISEATISYLEEEVRRPGC
jgi:putative transposase